MVRRSKKGARSKRKFTRTTRRPKKSRKRFAKKKASKKTVARLARAVRSIQREIRPVHRNIEHRPSALQLAVSENEVRFYSFLCGTETDHDQCKVNIFNAAGTAATWEKGSWYSAKQYMKTIFRNNYSVPCEIDIWKIRFKFPKGALFDSLFHDPLDAMKVSGTENGLGTFLSYLAGPPVTLDSPIMQFGPGMCKPSLRSFGWVITGHHNVFLNPQEEVSVSTQTKFFKRYQEETSGANLGTYTNWTRGYIVRIRGRPGHGDDAPNPSTAQGWMEAKLDCQHLIKNYVRGRGSVAGMATKHEWIDPTFGTGLEIIMADNPSVEAAPG